MTTLKKDFDLFLDHAELKNELKSILSYWQEKMIDDAFGGFYGRRDMNDELVHSAPKGVILNTRILWTFSRAYRHSQNPEYLKTADRAYYYIHKHFIDQEHAGVYWMLDANGNPIDKKKQIYAQAFAIYAFSEYYKITKNQASLDAAINLFTLIERHSFDKRNNGYLEAFDREWSLLDDLRLSEKDANEKITMNTHLHILEAYTTLYSEWKSDLLKVQLENLIKIFLDKFLSDDYYFHLFFDENWQLKSDEISFGHDIEGSWLIHEAAKLLENPSLLAQVEQLVIKVVDRTIEKGLDGDGGLLNAASTGGHLDDDKHWWPQAEAMVGLINAWQITGNEDYLKTCSKIWNFIKKHLIDQENGEWHWKTDRSGHVIFTEDKAGPWKCPYHNGRALIEILERFFPKD